MDHVKTRKKGRMLCNVKVLTFVLTNPFKALSKFRFSEERKNNRVEEADGKTCTHLSQVCAAEFPSHCNC
jgi:hypothetical protein